MNILFEPLDVSKVTSGLLLDYAFESVEIAPFDGLPSDSNYVNAITWINLYGSIYDAKINSSISLETPDTVAQKFVNATAAGNAIPLVERRWYHPSIKSEFLTPKKQYFLYR